MAGGVGWGWCHEVGGVPIKDAHHLDMLLLLSTGRACCHHLDVFLLLFLMPGSGTGLLWGA